MLESRQKRLDSEVGRAVHVLRSDKINNRRGSFRRPLVDRPIARKFLRWANRCGRLPGHPSTGCVLPVSPRPARAGSALPIGEPLAREALDRASARALPGSARRMSMLRRHIYRLYSGVGSMRCARPPVLNPARTFALAGRCGHDTSSCDIARAPKTRCDKPARCSR